MHNIVHTSTAKPTSLRHFARPGLSTRTLAALAGLVVGLAEGSASAQVVAGPIQYGGHVYYLVGPGGWTECEAQAVAMGGHMVTIDDAAENQWVLATFGPHAQGLLWIGLRANAPLGSWSWASGSSAPYRNWANGEPNNGCSPELYVVIYPGGAWFDGPNDPIGCNGSPPAYGVVEVPCTTMPPTSTWTGAANDNDLWDTPANWSPAGRPGNNSGAAFDSPGARTILIPPNRMIGQLDVRQGSVNLHVSSGQFSNPTAGCVPPGGSLDIGNAGQTASCSLFGDFSFNNLTIIGYGNNSQATLAVDLATLRTTSGVVLGLGDLSQATLTLDGGPSRLLQSGSFGVVCGSGDDTISTINILNGATLQYSTATPFKVGYGAGSHATVNVAGNFELTSSLIPSGSGSQILLGAGSPPPGGTTTNGTINLHTRGLVRATEIRLGAEVRTRGTITMDGGTLDVESLVIADKGDGTLDWSGGTITGLRQITIGNTIGTSGQLLLDGPSHSLTLATPIGGETQNLFAGKTGRGRISVTSGAAINLSSGSLGGLSIGATDSAGGGGVEIKGHDPNNQFFRSRIVGSAESLLSVGKAYTIPNTVPAMLIDEGARATFGTVYVGREDWMDGEIHVRNSAILQQIMPDADIFSFEGLQIRGTPGGAHLRVDSGGQVQCTAGVAYGLNNPPVGPAGPVVTVTGESSTLNCSGPFYVYGPLPEGGKMHVGEGAVMSSHDLSIGLSGFGGQGQPGALSLDGPRQVLTNSGTLFIGVDGDPSAPGILALTNGAKVHTHRLALGSNHSITTDVAGPPAIIVGGSPLLPPDIQCDTLIVGDSFNLPGLDISFGADAGIGGHGTWSGSFDSAGEVVVPAGMINNPESPMPRLVIDGNLIQHATSRLEVAQTFCGYSSGGGDFLAPIGSFLSVAGDAHIDGTLRLTVWAIAMSDPNASINSWGLIGYTLPVLTAASVAGTFNAIEFGPGFPTNRVQLTYEPTRVLVTFLPPVCDTSIQTQPTDHAACTQGNAAFSVSASGSDELSSNLTYQWYHLVYWGDGPELVPINDGPNAHQFGALYTAAGTTTPNLSLTIDPAFFYETGNPHVPLRCLITNACGETITSDFATLTVCAPDFDCDGALDFFDYDAFVACFEGTICPPGKTADFDADGTVDFFDYDAFVVAFEEGC
ncbi:MAG: lectin-like protein [Planctomycetota bacterium]